MAKKREKKKTKIILGNQKWIRVEISETENRKAKEKINKNKSLFFEKIFFKNH